MSDFNGKMYNVHSGNLAQVGWEYDETNKCGVMRAMFKTGRVYDYYPVTKEKFGEIFKQDSKGSWFNREIVNDKSISYEEVTD